MEFSYSVMCLVIFVINYQLESWMAKSTEETYRPTTVYAIAGKTAAIPCDAHPSSRSDSVALILWYKDNSTTPMYSLDARQGKLDQARHAAKDILMTRAFLNILSEPAALQLDPVWVTDEGEYKCRADFRNERTRYSSVTVKVVVESEKPVIRDSEGEILQSLVGPYNEGDELLLICEVKGGKPLPTVTWWRETVLLDDTYHLMSPNTVRNELQIIALKRHDLMAVFTCRATNNNITAALFSSVTVDMNFRPLAVSIEGDKGPMDTGQQVELTCRVTGSRPPALLTWWLGKRQLISTKDMVSVDGNITTSVLSFSPSSSDSGSYLSCRAENPLIAGSTIEYGWTLNVHFAPIVSLRLSGKLHHSPIREGIDVYLECEVESNPPFTELTWMFEGKHLHANRTAGIIITNQTLILQKIQRSNSGRYICAATNSQKTVESNPILLQVQYSPVCTQQDKVVYSGGKNQPVRVSCEVDSDPVPLSFRWKVNTSLDTGQILTAVNDGPRRIATYIPRSDADFGIIECWGKNSIGEQLIPCVYVILPADPPEKIKSCTVGNQTETSFVVHCIEGYHGGAAQVFVMEVYEDSETKTLHSNQTSDLATFIVRDLRPGSNYRLLIYSYNSVGRSKSISINTSTLPSPSSLTRIEDDWQDTFPPLFLVLTIVSIGLTLSILLIVAVVKTRQKIAARRGAASSNLDDKCDTPLRKDTDDEWKSCSYIGDEKGPDIIPEIKDSNPSDDIISEDISVTAESQGRDTEHIKFKMKPASIVLLQSSPTNRNRVAEHNILQTYLSSPSKERCTSPSPLVCSRQTKV